MTSAPPPGGPPGSGPPPWQPSPGDDPRSGSSSGSSVGQGRTSTAPRPSQAPTRSNRAVIVTILIAVLVIGGGASAWLLSTPSVDRSTPRGAAEAFASAVNNRDFDALDRVICSDNRFDVRPGGQIVQVLSQITLRLDDVTSEGNQGTADYTATAIIGATATVKAPLERDTDSGLWTVCLPQDLGN